MNNFLDWLDVGQVFELERIRECAGKAEVEVAYGITSLTRARPEALSLLLT